MALIGAVIELLDGAQSGIQGVSFSIEHRSANRRELALAAQSIIKQPDIQIESDHILIDARFYLRGAKRVTDGLLSFELMIIDQKVTECASQPLMFGTD